MAERYVAFDVETPNFFNDRMSAIGITVVENGRIVDSFSTLVNPECRFDAFNIQLTGITPELASAAPTFAELWPVLGPMLEDGVLLAHNAPFDLSVLAKCLLAYGIVWKPHVVYACTCQMGRRCYPQMPNHKLNTLCEFAGIALDHHQAGSDSRACAELFLNYREQGLDTERFLRSYDLLHVRTISGERKSHGVRL